MDSTRLPLAAQLGDEPFAFARDTLIDYLAVVPESRQARGLRYPLAPLLALAVLAKLAGHPNPRAIASWAKLREADLIPFLHWPRRTMPHPTTWTRAFAPVDTTQLDIQIGAFFAQRRPLGPARPGDIVLSIDGKTLRGTIPAGASHGVHLVAAYLPSVGCVLAELAVTRKANELTVAPTLLAWLDLQGLVVTGDALFAQRALSAQIVAAGGEYVWTVKGNQPALRDDIAWLFAPLRPGEQAAAFGWRTGQVVSKEHGRLEERAIVVSAALVGYSDWPGLAQVFQLTVRRTTRRGTSESVRYGVTSLTAEEASPERLIALTRGHWGIDIVQS
jgi:hypothetical protein